MTKRGTIVFRNGRARARITIDGEEHSKTFDTEEDAQAWMDELCRLADEATAGKRVKTIANLAETFFRERESAGYVANTKRERSVWNVHIKDDPVTLRPIVGIQEKHLVDWTERMAAAKTPNGKTRSRQTQKHAVSIMRAFFVWAKRRGHVDTNHSDELVPVKVRAKEMRHWAYLETDEIYRVLALTHEDDLRTLERHTVYAIAIFAGLRKSEIWHLRWERVHLGDNPRIEVREPIKADASRRDVPLLPPAIEALKRWRARGGVYRRTGLVFPIEDKRVAVSHHERMYGRHHEGYDAGWSDHRYREKATGKLKVRPGSVTRAGIDRRVRFHDLRHTYCSHLAMGTWGQTFSLYEIKDLAGHSDIEVTQRYAHLSPHGVRGAMAAMREAWEETQKAAKEAAKRLNDESAMSRKPSK